MDTKQIKILSLRRDGACGCGVALRRGARAGWDRTSRTVVCLSCLQPTDSGEQMEHIVEVGTPGASLQQTYERRLALREQRVMTKHPRIGRLVLRLQRPKQTTQAFATGAEGERRVAEVLQTNLEDALFLFNRRLSASSRHGDVDLIAITASGIHVIDAKHYAGRRVRSTRKGDALVVDGRRRQGLVAGLHRQVAAVQESVDSGPVPANVHGAFCFLEADLPWGRLVVDGIPVRGPRTTRKALARPGTLPSEDRRLLHEHLARNHPSA
ncbi:nuclease-related domain-containing protein [Aeromicrobium sp. CF4.19]|uniref:nuclease-related domain-containing protein n=1 Tax=Aeromicrobium sp. CF4.19 TaxID=3373082 RepID=UPI003EE6C782